MTPALETGRLTLTPYVEADEDDFTALFCDPQVVRWMDAPRMSEKAYRALFRYAFRATADHDGDLWAVRSEGRYVGHGEIKRTPLVPGHEIVFALTPAVWGKGFGVELVRALVGYGHTTLGLIQVYATVDAANPASLAVLKRAAFRYLRDIDTSSGGRSRVLVHDWNDPCSREAS